MCCDHRVPPPYASTLDDPYQRFLASLTEHGLELGLRTSEDFVRHFSPRVIMSSLASDPALRATLLEEAIGIKRKVGLRKTPASAGEDLQIALDEGVTSEPAIVEIFTADERARHLPAADLWAYVTEAEFWKVTNDDEAWATSRDHVAFFLESALANGLLTPRKIIEGVTLARLVHYLPEPVIEQLFASALSQARMSEAFSEEEMMFVATAAVLAEHVPLADLWNTVITGLAPGAKAAAQPPAKKSPTPAPRPIATAPLAASETRVATIEMAVPPPAVAPQPIVVGAPPPVAASSLTELDEPDHGAEAEAEAEAEEVEEAEETSAAMAPPKMPARGPTVPLPPGKPVPRPPSSMSRPSMATPEIEGGKRASRRPR